MADLLALSTRLIDTGVLDEPAIRITNDLSEIADGIAVVESFSNSVALKTGEGLVVFDTSSPMTGPAVVESLRRWSTDRVHTIVYTHGHVDHVGGSPAFAADARERSHDSAQVIGHEAVTARLARYRLTDGYNRAVNARQFGHVFGAAAPRAGRAGDETPFLPTETVAPTVAYRDQLHTTVGGVDLELRHDRGETDDHTWTWIPEHRMLAAGDFMIWHFPNCGNPQKVQRYPSEWAAALRKMAALGAELFVPAHGLPIEGAARISTVLTTIASTLEDLVAQVLDAMNVGASLDEVVNGCRVPDDVLALPYMRPFYDEPEFVVNNLWRLYGGWWDGDAATLKPPRVDAVAAEVADLAGGTEVLVARARALAEHGDLRMACRVIEWAARAEPESVAVHDARAEIYESRRNAERSLMAKGIFGTAATESRLVTDSAGRRDDGSGAAR